MPIIARRIALCQGFLLGRRRGSTCFVRVARYYGNARLMKSTIDPIRIMTDSSQEKTGLGNYFVANYPPFSAWKPEHLPAAQAALAAPPRPDTPLGLYVHIPFCRKRCKFCYFKVYTDKNASEIELYLDALIKENELYSL